MMSSRKALLDPPAALAGLVVGIGAFLLIPGIGWALLAAIAVAVLAYGVVISVRALSGGPNRATRPAVGAGGDAIAPPRVRRGSVAEAWVQRGRKTVDDMRRLVAASDQPVIRGQLENVVLEAGDSIPVLQQLAEQDAVVQSSLHRLSPAGLRDQREELQAAAADPSSSPAMIADKQRAIDSVAEQEATLNRLLDTQAGLRARMESIVLGLERLSAQMSETIATAATSIGSVQSGDEAHLRDLGEQLQGLQAGLEESRHYTAQILGPQTE